MGRVHFIGGEKGGVGKSVVSRLLVQYCIDHGKHLGAFDTDRSHGALLRYYPSYSVPVDPAKMGDLDQIIEMLDRDVDEVVVDLAAQTEGALIDWLEAGEVLDLMNDLGHSLWYWYVIDDGKDSIVLLDRMLERLGHSVPIICVRNHGRGRSFKLFDDGKFDLRIGEAGGRVIDLPALHESSMLKIDHYDKSFWAAIHNTDPEEGPCLGLMERQRAKVFMRKAHAAIGGLLDPESSNSN